MLEIIKIMNKNNKKNKDIKNKNNKGQFHGYNEWYDDNKLLVRCNYKNGNKIGYQEYHYFNQAIYYTIR